MNAEVAQAAPTHTLRDLLAGNPTLAALQTHMQPLSAAQRVKQVQEMNGNQLSTLWRIASAGRPLTVAEVIPPTRPPFEPLIYKGKNSLPAFSLFEKHVYLDDQGRAFGCNVQSFSPLTGPGYFAVVPHPDRPDELIFDYSVLPDRAPHGWPAIVSNSRALSYFVFHKLRDEMRQVSRSVLIGKATRNGRDMGQYFALVLES
jgi:hypothetical protein